MKKTIEKKSEEPVVKKVAAKKAAASEGTVSLEVLHERIKEIVTDDQTIAKFVGSNSVGAFKATMKFLDDLLSPKPQLKYVPPPVKKLHRD